MKIEDLFDPLDLIEMIRQGYVSMREHLDLPLYIYNYTDQCQFGQVWNDVTVNCRGLIADADGNIVARGFPKFFNYGQPGAAEFTSSTLVEVTDKADGSLGILYPTPDGYAIATRGSFHSDQAIHATLLYNLLYADTNWPAGINGFTVLFEIIYPDNRIVLDYGDENDLVLLGMVDNETGKSYGPNNLMLLAWNGPRAYNFGRMTFADALAMPPRINAEGLVIRNRYTGEMVKVKQEDYIRLHKLVFGLSEKAVWEHLSTHDGDITGMLEGLPDEFHGWVKDKTAAFLDKFWIVSSMAKTMYNAIRTDDRKEFAARAQEYPELRQYLFMLFDGKDISGAVWKSLKPKGSSPMVRQTEATA